jgi:hypothetical protein
VPTVIVEVGGELSGRVREGGMGLEDTAAGMDVANDPYMPVSLSR